MEQALALGRSNVEPTASHEVKELRDDCEAEFADLRSVLELARQDVDTLTQGMQHLELLFAKWRAEVAVEASKEPPCDCHASAPGQKDSDQQVAGLRAEVEALRTELSPTVAAQGELVGDLQASQQALEKQVQDYRALVESGIEGAQWGLQGALQGLQQLSGVVKCLGREIREGQVACKGEEACSTGCRVRKFCGCAPGSPEDRPEASLRGPAALAAAAAAVEAEAAPGTAAEGAASFGLPESRFAAEARASSEFVSNSATTDVASELVSHIITSTGQRVQDEATKWLASGQLVPAHTGPGRRRPDGRQDNLSDLEVRLQGLGQRIDELVQTWSLAT